jgi:hypothetical protein
MVSIGVEGGTLVKLKLVVMIAAVALLVCGAISRPVADRVAGWTWSADVAGNKDDAAGKPSRAGVVRTLAGWKWIKSHA